LFLEWGYEHELSKDKICWSARITASLSPYWRWIEADQDPLTRLALALAAAQRNQDREGENLVRKALANFSSKEAFQDVQSLRQQSDKLNFFEFETITVDRHGKIIKREIKQAEQISERLPNDVFLDIVAIKGGTFIMGSLEGEGSNWEQPQHEVTVPSFFMGKYPVTQAQWKAVAKLPKVNRDLEPDPSNFKGNSLPVERVSWYHAVEFCDRLSQYTGKQYRLLSEAEWEYACRAGTTTPFHFGEAITLELANYNASRQQTTPVGSFPANAFGLYDMHGQVWEWCADYWHSSYERAPTDGSAWLTDSNSQVRLLRGGSWDLNSEYCRSAYRSTYNPRSVYRNIGFRVVCGGAVARTF